MDVQVNNILDPDYYYYDTFYPVKQKGVMPPNPLFPYLEDLLEEQSKKAERLRK